MFTIKLNDSTTERLTEKDIFIFSYFWIKKMLYPVNQVQKVHIHPYNFYVSCFLSSGIHQSQCLDGLQALGKSPSFIEAF